MDNETEFKNAMAGIEAAVDEVLADDAAAEKAAVASGEVVPDEAGEETQELPAGDAGVAKKDIEPDDDSPAADGLVADETELDDETLQRAVDAGMKLKDAKAFKGNKSGLENVIALLESRSAAKPTEDREVAKAKAEDELPDLDPNEYDEKVVAHFKALKAQRAKDDERIAALEQQLHQQKVESAEEWFDGQIKDLGEDFEAVLGKGTVKDIAFGSAAFKKRGEIAERMEVLANGYIASGKPVPSDKALFDESVKIVLEKEIKAADERKLASKLEKRAGQHIARAGGSATKPRKSAEEEVISEIDEKIARMKAG